MLLLVSAKNDDVILVVCYVLYSINDLGNSLRDTSAVLCTPNGSRLKQNDVLNASSFALGWPTLICQYPLDASSSEKILALPSLERSSSTVGIG